MQLRILGAHQTTSATSKATSMLVDGIMAIDAGSIAAGLTLNEQDKIKFVLLTHQHYDHLKDLPALGLNVVRSGSMKVYCISETREAIFAHLLNEVLWPDLTKMPSPEHPVMTFFTIQPFQPFDVNGYRVFAVPSDHPVPTVGYQVESDGRRLFYTSDMGGNGEAVWPYVDPHVLVTEVTFPNRFERVAAEARHLTPADLGSALERFRALKNYVPRVVVLHVNAHFDGEVRQEIAELATNTGADIQVAYENMVVEV